MFYPGDYLRDTQCLSEKAQVAYDRIMCEHMRNICITQEQLNFFTKRLSEDEKQEVIHVLTKIKGGYEIHWVAESIRKRNKYSESRQKNRLGKTKPKSDNISSTYVNHMEDEDENENKDRSIVKRDRGSGGKGTELMVKIEEDTLLMDEYHLETVEMANHLPKGSASELARWFFRLQKSVDKIENRTLSNYKQHFSNWVAKEITRAKEQRKGTKAEVMQDHWSALQSEMRTNPEQFYKDALKSLTA